MLKAISLRLEQAQYEHLRALSFVRRKPMSQMIREAVDAYLRDWEATLEEITLAGDDLPAILQARDEARAGVGMTPDELRTYLESDDEQWQRQPASPLGQSIPA